MSTFKEIDAGIDYQTSVAVMDDIFFQTYTEESDQTETVVISKNALLRFVRDNFPQEEIDEA